MSVLEDSTLEAPSLLLQLLRSGEWPATTGGIVTAQNSGTIIHLKRVHSFAPEENALFLYTPPFHSIASELRFGRGLTAAQQATHEIEPALVFVIGDFGPGSDTTLALDYRSGRMAPSVIRLEWRLPDAPNRWVCVAESFEAFWRILVPRDISVSGT